MATALAATGCSQWTRALHEPPAELQVTRQPGETVAERPDDAVIWRTLSRAGFGPLPGDVDRVREMGVDAYLEEQLHPDGLEESPAVAWRLWQLDSLEADTDFRYDLPKEQVQAELQQASVIRARYSRRQLREAMVEFWSDHFNVSQLKGDSAFLKTAEDDAVIRRHALGKFRDLLWASAHSPAMLYYLDNARNTRSAVNENYARELMELHTLGVSGGYTQRDVQEVARCFTGWSIQDEGTWWRGAFVYDAHHHDDGARRVLGVSLPRGLGRRHGERVLEILAEHPATARFIARKLCRRFVADEELVSEAFVERLARVFEHTDGDIRQLLSVLLRSPEFRRGSALKLKRPFDFALSALRALNADTNGRGILPHLRQMGQTPFQWAMPNGYPDHTRAWLSSLLGRWNFAVALLSGGISGTRVDLRELTLAARATTPAEQRAVLQSLILGHVLPEPEERRLLESLAASSPDAQAGPHELPQTAALLLMSPAFQWR